MEALNIAETDRKESATLLTGKKNGKKGEVRG